VGVEVGELERHFQEEPLKSVDLTELRRQRTKEEVRKVMEFLVTKKHVLSDGRLNYTDDSRSPHNTTCDIKTTEENPRIVSTPRPVNPKEREEQEAIIREKLEEGVIEPSCAPYETQRSPS
jgi:hypothetical protein